MGAITLSTSSTADLIDSIANVVGAIAWPAAIFGVAMLFRERIREFIAVITKRAKSDDVEVTAGRFLRIAVARSTAYMAAATAQRSDSEAHADEKADGEARGVARAEELAAALEATTGLVADIAIHAASRSRAAPRILWVDKTPHNNVYERQAFEALGIDVVTRTSTQHALDLLDTQSFDVIISNMDRPPDNRAGYTLLDELRPNITTPFIVYSSSNEPKHIDEARERGALGATNDPSELLALVQKALVATPGSTG